MTATTTTVRNGVDTTALLTTREAVRTHPELPRFQFRATNRWISGTHTRSTIDGYSGAGAELDRAGGFTFDADHPPVLTGSDNGPTPVEFLLHALAACLTAGVVDIAAARGITLTSELTSVVGTGDAGGSAIALAAMALVAAIAYRFRDLSLTVVAALGAVLLIDLVVF